MAPFLPGESVFFTCLVENFRLKDVEFKIPGAKVSWEAQAFDFNGLEVGEKRTGVVEDRVDKEKDKAWRPKIFYDFFVPPMAERGEFEIRIKVRDEYAETEVERVIPVMIDGKRLPDVDKISVANFGFFRREQDRSSLTIPVYQEGDAVWTKFDIVGFEVGEKNTFHVGFDVQILDEAGEVLFEQPSVGNTKKSPEYPQRYVPGVYSIEIKPGTPKGKYALAVVARDELAGTSAREIYPFSIE
jgi:hypothetical protein